MDRRVNKELLLVGSLPAESADAASRAGADFFADLVFALPDGETAPRAAWVGYERERRARPNPNVVVVHETESPTGINRPADETPVFSARGDDLQFASRPRIDDAIESSQVCRQLRDQGVIGPDLRVSNRASVPASAMNAEAEVSIVIRHVRHTSSCGWRGGSRLGHCGDDTSHERRSEV